MLLVVAGGAHVRGGFAGGHCAGFAGIPAAAIAAIADVVASVATSLALREMEPVPEFVVLKLPTTLPEDSLVVFIEPWLLADCVSLGVGVVVSLLVLAVTAVFHSVEERHAAVSFDVALNTGVSQCLAHNGFVLLWPLAVKTAHCRWHPARCPDCQRRWKR